jgi:hypothetical protein
MSNLVQQAISYGGKIAPLIIKDGYYPSIGYMNPSVFVDDDGEILVNLRHINYTLYHSENNQKFPSRWGPLAYLHPEQDLTLRTVNYMCRLDKDLNMTDHAMVDTSALDVQPLWEFHGLEDARLVKWDESYYLVGVRRDTTPNGQGRMELSKIELDKENWSAKEVSRLRIPAPGENMSYCEKNWVPILDKPYHFIKWTSPTEIVRTYSDLPERCEQVSLKKGIDAPADQRGGSHAVKWGDYYIAFPHEVYLYNNYLGQKDGIYRHRLCVWDKEFNLVGLSSSHFSFLDAKVEFCAGAAKYNDDLLITFGFQDNAAFILQVPKNLVDNLIEEALLNGK